MTRNMLSLGRRFAAVAAILVLGGCAASGTPRPQMQTRTQNASLPELMKLAEQSREAGNESVAADIYEKAAERFPDSPKPYIGLGHAARASGQPSRATAAFRAALERDEDSLAARYGLGQSLLAGDRLKAAIEQFDVLIDAGTTDHRPYLSKGVALDLLDKHAAAQKSYRAGLKHAPDNVALKNNLGLSLALSENYREAMRTLEAVVRDPTAPARARQNLALVYGMAGDMQRAAVTAGEDLSPQAVERNVAYYRALNELRGERAPASGKPETNMSPAPGDSNQQGKPATSPRTRAPSTTDTADTDDITVPPGNKPVQLAAAVGMPPPATDSPAAADSPDAEASATPLEPDPSTRPDSRRSEQAQQPVPAAEQSDTTGKQPPQSRQLAAKRADTTGPESAPAAAASKPDDTKSADKNSPERGTTLAEAMRTRLSATPQQDAANGKVTYWAQFASFDSPESGKAEWRRLQKLYPKLVAGLPLSLHTAELPEKGTFYRVRTGPFDARQDPDRLCDALAEHGQGCLVVER